MMLIFPFEEAIYQENQIPAVFIGHPLVKRARLSLSQQEFFEKLDLNKKEKLISLFPGSRKSEIKRHLPVLIKALSRIKERYNCQFVLKLSENMEKKEVSPYLKRPHPPIKIVNQFGYETIACSDLVLSACGTANLEAALLGTPLVSFYRISPLSYLAGKKMVKIKHFSIVNIIAGKKIIPELIQKNFNPKSLMDHVSEILDSEETKNSMKQEFKKIKKELGDKDAASNAARELEQLL